MEKLKKTGNFKRVYNRIGFSDRIWELSEFVAERVNFIGFFIMLTNLK